MTRMSLDHRQCPIARAAGRLGQPWSILLLRDASHGLTRFDQFQKSLGIGPATVSRRLAALVADGMLERHRYSARPPRDEYRLTERGRDFLPVLWALLAFGNKHFAPEGRAVVIVDRETGAEAEPVLVDGRSFRPLTQATFRTAAMPVANERLQRRHAPPVDGERSAS